jgi:glutaconyl-CoA/methylmalonyl-CoA decarboxylase subunit gamma
MRHELSAMLGGREVAVTVERGRDGQWRVAVDGGPERPVDAVEIRPGTWSILVDGRSLLVDVDRRAGRTALLVGGEEVAFELADARKRRLAQAVAGRPTTSGESIRAPIAGRVVKLLVEVGQSVAAGQGVAVLEAMKMENEIRADRGGTVAAIGAQPGQSVETGALLVTLK